MSKSSKKQVSNYIPTVALLMSIVTLVVAMAIKGNPDVPLAQLTYNNTVYEAEDITDDRYVSVHTLSHLFQDMGIVFEDYKDTLVIQPMSPAETGESDEPPREYDLYGYWFAVQSDKVIGFQFQSSDEWGPYTVVKMTYEADIDMATETFDIKEVQSIEVGQYWISSIGSINFQFLGVTHDFDSGFTEQKSLETYTIEKAREGFTFRIAEDSFTISPVSPDSESIEILE